MKNLSEIKQPQFITLEGLNKADAEKLQNLDRQPINECCGCCCNPEPCCGSPIENPNQIVWYYSEEEIVRLLSTKPKVQDLGNIHRQFNNYLFKAHCPNETPQKQEPLFFREKIVRCDSQTVINNHDDWMVRNFIMNNLKCNDPVVLYKLQDAEIQIFYVYYPEGDEEMKQDMENGIVPTGKKALALASKHLMKLEKRPEVKWAQVVDVSIDVLDARYAFLVTCTLNQQNFMKSVVMPQVPAVDITA